MDAFSEKFSARILRKYLIYTKDIRKSRDIQCFPTGVALREETDGFGSFAYWSISDWMGEASANPALPDKIRRRY